jgi:hypothetical protein
MLEDKMLWDWVAKIAALHEKKIEWLPGLDDRNKETFILAVDGTYFWMWEGKHPTLPIDCSQCSHKFKHGAVKYEITISTYSSKICWISGPHAGGKHDLAIFREGLKQKIAPGKKVHAVQFKHCRRVVDVVNAQQSGQHGIAKFQVP